MRTLADLQDRLRQYVGNDGSDQKSTAVTRASCEAVEGIASRHEWLYFVTYGRVTTSAPYNTGTVSFDYTGGTYERMLTLVGGVLPAWVAGYGTLTINAVPYDIDQRISDTVCTLKADNSPAADFSSTAYQIYRARYDLPVNFQSIHKPILTSYSTRLEKMSLTDFVYRRNLNDGPAQPYMFTTVDNSYGRSQILLWNPPAAVYSLEFDYKRKPPRPIINSYSTGRIALTSGSTALTGTTTGFLSSMAGCVLRVSYNQEVPTAPDGLNPPQFEYLISETAAITSTGLTLATAATDTVSNRAFTISSRVDVEDGPMFNFLVQIGYKNLRIAQRMNFTQEERPEYEKAEQEAKAWDGQKYSGTDVAGMDMDPGVMRGSYLRNVG